MLCGLDDHPTPPPRRPTPPPSSNPAYLAHVLVVRGGREHFRVTPLLPVVTVGVLRERDQRAATAAAKLKRLSSDGGHPWGDRSGEWD